MILLQAATVTLFALVHLFAGRLAALNQVPRNRWLSAAGGISVAYVFVHIFPELAEIQEQIQGSASALSWLEHHAYLVSLIGLASLYGVEQAAKRSGRRHQRDNRPDDTPPLALFWVHIGSFALYNALVGYLLVHREEPEPRGLLVYAVAMTVHFVVNDFGLQRHHRADYHARARWALAAAPVAGWLLGLSTTLSETATGALYGLLAGGVILNVLKEELPEERRSRFAPFALAAGAYAAILLLT